MKKYFTAVTALLIFATGCGKDNEVTVTPNQNSNANAFTAGIIAQGGMPKSKESISFNQIKHYRTVGNFSCAYRVDTDVVVTNSNNNNLRMRVKNESQGGSRNSSYCPFYHPTMRDFHYQTMTTSEFVQQTTQKINSALNPGIYCAEKKEWCANFRTIQRADTSKHGIPAILVEAEFQHRNGDILNRKVWISKVSLLQNVFEVEMTNVRTGEIIDYKRLKPTRRGQRAPRR